MANAEVRGLIKRQHLLLVPRASDSKLQLPGFPHFEVYAEHGGLCEGLHGAHALGPIPFCLTQLNSLDAGLGWS